MTMTAPCRRIPPVIHPVAPCAADCSNCGGSGKVWLDSDGNGPWKGKKLVDCPLCEGSGQS